MAHPTIDYGTGRQSRWLTRPVAYFLGGGALVFLIFYWATGSDSLLVSNRLWAAENEAWTVRVLERDPGSLNAALGGNKSSFMGFHYITWSGWRRDGRYLLIPKWAVLSLMGAILGIAIYVGQFRAGR